jgi:hypothetical protein
MKQLAFITVGRSAYDDRLQALLDDTGIDPQEFESLDYFSLIPIFLLAGASVRTAAQAHGDHMHLEGWYVEVEDDLEPIFFDELPNLLAQMADEPA